MRSVCTGSGQFPQDALTIIGFSSYARTLSAVELAGLETDYEARFCTPVMAAERGLVDDVIDPLDTRRVLGAALAGLATKRERPTTRKHTISPC